MSEVWKPGALANSGNVIHDFMNVVLPDIYVYAASALLMRAMLELEVELVMGITSGGSTGLSPPPPAASENFSSSGFVSLIFFLSAKDKRRQKNT